MKSKTPEEDNDSLLWFLFYTFVIISALTFLRLLFSKKTYNTFGLFLLFMTAHPFLIPAFMKAQKAIFEHFNMTSQNGAEIFTAVMSPPLIMLTMLIIYSSFMVYAEVSQRSFLKLVNSFCLLFVLSIFAVTLAVVLTVYFVERATDGVKLIHFMSPLVTILLIHFTLIKLAQNCRKGDADIESAKEATADQQPRVGSFSGVNADEKNVIYLIALKYAVIIVIGHILMAVSWLTGSQVYAVFYFPLLILCYTLTDVILFCYVQRGLGLNILF